MSDGPSTPSSCATSHVHLLHDAHLSPDATETLGEGMCQLSLHSQACLAYLPVELLLAVTPTLEKRDWLALARTCQRLANVLVPELDRYGGKREDYYALWHACVTNNPDVLLHQIALDPSSVNVYFPCHFRHRVLKHPHGMNMTPLAVSITVGSLTAAEILLAHGADPNRPDKQPVMDDQLLLYPINWASVSKFECSVPLIRMLKACSADMNQLPEDVTACAPKCASGMQCAPIFRVLGLDLPRPHASRRRKQTTCDMYNNDLRKLQCLRLRQLTALLECGADPNGLFREGRESPIFFLLSSLAHYTPSFYFSDRLIVSHEANDQAHLMNEIVVSFLSILRDFGAVLSSLGNIKCRGSTVHPETPLHTVCRLDDWHKPLICWFLDNGISINSLDKARRTPLMIYCRSRFTDIDWFRWFLSNNPDINHQDMLGRTALHELCDNEELWPQVKEKAVRMLLDTGADPTLLNMEGGAPGHRIHNTKHCRSRYEDVGLMLRCATKQWKERCRDREKLKPENEAMGANTQSDSREDDHRSEHGNSQAEALISHRACRRGSQWGSQTNDQGASRKDNKSLRGSRRGYRGTNRRGYRGGYHGNQGDRPRGQPSQNL
ncbi:ankyrin repeat-containing domain protein [Nemania diffusa]|nr:ankyrin repeat-containing domain protein [Nemania diffusa]